jgi:hypothetical protein
LRPVPFYGITGFGHRAFDQDADPVSRRRFSRALFPTFHREGQVIAKPAQLHNFAFQLREPLLTNSQDLITRTSFSLSQFEEMLDLVQTEPETLRLTNEAQLIDVFLTVYAVA